MCVRCVGVGWCVCVWCVYREGGMRVCTVVFVMLCVEVLCAGIGVV